MAEGKQPQAPFAVVQQTWSERQLQLWGQYAARTVSRFPFKIVELAIVKTNAVLRLSAAMPPMAESTIDLSLSSPSLRCVICQQILDIVIRYRPFVPFAVDEDRRSS